MVKLLEPQGVCVSLTVGVCEKLGAASRQTGSQNIHVRQAYEESPITLESLHTLTHTNTHNKCMCTNAAHQQVEPVQHSSAASESHLLVKLLSH